MEGIQEIFRSGEGVFWLEHGPARPAFVSRDFLFVFSYDQLTRPERTVQMVLWFRVRPLVGEKLVI